jgi:hypothetical protein
VPSSAAACGGSPAWARRRRGHQLGQQVEQFFGGQQQFAPAVDGGAAQAVDQSVGIQARIGAVNDRHPGMVTMATTLGVERVLDMPLGEQLPRIC